MLAAERPVQAALAQAGFFEQVIERRRLETRSPKLLKSAFKDLVVVEFSMPRHFRDQLVHNRYRLEQPKSSRRSRGMIKTPRASECNAQRERAERGDEPAWRQRWEARRETNSCSTESGGNCAPFSAIALC